MLIKYSMMALIGLFIAFAGFAMEKKGGRKVTFGENETRKIIIEKKKIDKKKIEKKKIDKKEEKKPPKNNSSKPDEGKLDLVDNISWDEFQEVLKEWDQFQILLKESEEKIAKGDNLQKYDGTVLEYILTNWRDGVNEWIMGIHWYQIMSQKLLCRMEHIQHLFKRKNLQIVVSIEDEKKILSKFLTGRFSFIFDEKNFEQECKSFRYSPLRLL